MPNKSDYTISVKLEPMPKSASEHYIESLVFVYGSLKKGFGNHSVLGSSRLVSESVTVDAAYDMGSFRAYPACVKNGENVIHGEVYAVNRNTMRNLDRLESNGVFYNREQVDVRLLNENKTVKAWVYFLIDNAPPRCPRVKTISVNDTKALSWANPFKR